MRQRWRIVRIDADGRVFPLPRDRYPSKRRAAGQALLMTTAARAAGTGITYRAVPEVLDPALPRQK